MFIAMQIVQEVQDPVLKEQENSKVTFLFTLLDLVLVVKIKSNITVATHLVLLEMILKVADKIRWLQTNFKSHLVLKTTKQHTTEVKADRLQQKAEVVSELSSMMLLPNLLKVHAYIRPLEENVVYREKKIKLSLNRWDHLPP